MFNLGGCNLSTIYAPSFIQLTIMNIVFNPSYILKPDAGRVLIIHRGGLQPVDAPEDDSFCGFIHPLHAIILAFIDGSEYNDIINKIMSYINIDETYIRHFIDSLLDANESKGFVYNNSFISFPPKTIISSNSKREINYFDPNIFIFEHLDLRQKRHSSVSKLTFMLTNKCKTDCYYCYADKRFPTDCKIPLTRFKQLIEEAVKLYVASIDLIGGEIFLYPHWKELLSILVEHNYKPLLSTKIPITESEIEFIGKTGLPLQVSLDSCLCATLKNMLRVKDSYIENMRQTFLLLLKYNVKVAIHTIITQRNSTIEDMQSIYDFLKPFSNTILYWKADLGGESIYVNDDIKGTIEPKPNSILNLIEYFRTLSSKCTFPLSYSGLNNSDLPTPTTDTQNDDMKMNNFLSRALCTGNFSQLFILPDGNVTICEELYWHPKFIIGNVLNQSLQDIWQSDKALNLYHLCQDDISNESACKTCKLFSKCRSLKQVCYRDVIRKYGYTHWDYPDAKCPLVKE